MINSKRVIVVLPAYNCEATLKKTFDEIPHDIVDEIILVDDASIDRTVILSKRLGIKTVVHEANMGYGANQKTCYREALQAGADVVVMLHPDYQYDPRLITAMSTLIAEGIYDVTLGSRILGVGALQGGMPFYKYAANRFLTALENMMIRQKLSEYHTGYRAFSRKVLETLPLLENSDDFVFDNQMLLQAFYFGFKVGEINCPTVYNKESSSISFVRSVKYGVGVIITGLQFMIAKSGFRKISIFDKHGKKCGSISEYK
ncbi:MAG: glycosyltransferase family 2 protein [Candidatus Omnitrophica bacterium]|nr:glycosyltransferase family 2 protein [Candidatus Omnitrophota bacterium]